NVVAIDGPADADMIEMRGHYHKLVLQLRIGPRQDSRDIVRIHGAELNRGRGPESPAQLESRQRFVRKYEVVEFCEVVAASLQQLRGSRPGHGNRKHRGRDVLQRWIRETENGSGCAATSTTAAPSASGDGPTPVACRATRGIGRRIFCISRRT